jgi:predicted tellurium resistance membrane protein TerC
MSLVLEALHAQVPKAYIYFAMAFSVFVEILNLRVRSHQGEPVKLHQPYVPAAEAKRVAIPRIRARKK